MEKQTPLFEFLIERRPVSLQGKSKNRERWKDFVKNEAAKIWRSPLIKKNSRNYLHVSIVYLCDDAPPDVDNIVKPILDALIGLIYEDDDLIADVESHRRYLSEPIDVTNLPNLLRNGALKGEECVYLKIENSLSLETYL